jgi:hypothetical protein
MKEASSPHNFMRAQGGGRSRPSDPSEETKEWTCSCPDWQWNRRTNCKHILFAISRILGLSIVGLGDADRRGRALADRILLIDQRVDESDATKKKIIWRLLGTRGCYNICFEPKNAAPVPTLFAPAPAAPTAITPTVDATKTKNDTKQSSDPKQDTKQVAPAAVATSTSNVESTTASEGTTITATTWPRTVDEALDLARRIVVSDRFRFTGGSEEAAATLASELRSSTGPRVPRYRRHPEEIDEDDIDEDDETEWRPSSSASSAPATGRPPRRAASIRGEAAISAAAQLEPDEDVEEDEKRASKPKKPAVPQKPYIGQPCPICLENFTESCEVVYCRRTCGNSSHVVCFARMAEFRRNTICPLCRAPMRLPTAKVKKESRKRPRPS